MELKQIKELMSAMERCGTTRVHLKKDDFELELERKNGHQTTPSSSVEAELEERYRMTYPPGTNAPLPPSQDRLPYMHHTQSAPQGSSPVGDKKEAATGTFITSPMVGTFYAAPSPDDPPFIKVGDSIEKGEVVCIVEAMKVMNEIKASMSGVIAEVLVDSGHPVEFGTKLFRIQ